MDHVDLKTGTVYEFKTATFPMSLQKRPLLDRLYIRYYTWRSNTLHRIGICSMCGWRRHRGSTCCDHCWEQNGPF